MSPNPALLPQTRSGRTFLVAASVLGVLGLTQVIALGWHLATGTTSRPRATDLPAFVSRDLDPPPAAPASTPVLVARATEPPPLSVTVAPAPVVATPAPRPQVNARDLLTQARQLRLRGDTRTALARCREALIGAPDNAEILSEMGTIYEQMGMIDRSSEQWQRIYDMGEATAGAAYQLAELKLRTGVAGPPPSVRAEREGNPTSPATAERETKIGIVDVALVEETDPTAEKRLSLKVTVKNRPGRSVDSNKVSIQAFFYDVVDGPEGKTVSLTNAETSFQWLTNPAQWDDATSQTLEATYFRPKASPKPVLAPSGKKPRKGVPTPVPEPEVETTSSRPYAGYIVRLYYNRELQDVRADPQALLQQFPPEQILGTE